MPQMTPIWWELMFIIFLTSLMLMIMIMYFNKVMKIKSLKKQYKTIKQNNWKW
uniref:ATP synthase F0 subunit 8 n=1 Tax=Leptocorisa chinensis TaxID=763192 RepID=UPI001FA6CAB5|nr:ATP synthase F0 subunit 8 [Leptocorisa chinensis]UNA68528.1 ATP synthase F0 subunit 8 [Leptocorisa chinensis]